MSALSSTDPRLARRAGSAPGQRRSARRKRWGLPPIGRRMATLGLLAALVLALLLAVPGLRGVLHQIRHIGLAWLGLALALELGSALSFVVVFRLFFDR